MLMVMAMAMMLMMIIIIISNVNAIITIILIIIIIMIMIIIIINIITHAGGRAGARGEPETFPVKGARVARAEETTPPNTPAPDALLPLAIQDFEVAHRKLR